MNNKKIMIDSDYVKSLYKTYIDVHEKVKEEKIEVTGEIKSRSMYVNACSKVNNFSLNNAKNELVDGIQKIRIKISQTMHALNDLEGGIDVTPYYTRNTNSKEYKDAKNAISGNLIKMDLVFFRQYYGDKCFEEKGKWYIELGNYKYNITDNSLYDKKLKKSIKVNYYVPGNYDNLSTLNTTTVFTGTTPQNSGTLIVQPTWNNNEKMVASATKFINEFANTDLKNNKNIIMGGSKFGSYSLQIAAHSGKLYDTVVCINAAALVTDKNVRPGARIQFKSISDLKKLDGKNIYFVVAEGELIAYRHHSGNSDWASCYTTQSYLYSGLRLVTRNCPNAEVYLVTNSKDTIYKSIKSKNYHYSQNTWSKLGINSKYHGHGYEGIIKDILNGSLCN